MARLLLLLLSFLTSASACSSFRLIPWLLLRKKTNCALYLNNNLNSIIKNHKGWIRRIRVNRGKFWAEAVDTLHLCFNIKAVSKSLMTTLVFSRSLATALKFLDVW